jgi:hypothetical protein
MLYTETAVRINACSAIYGKYTTYGTHMEYVAIAPYLIGPSQQTYIQLNSLWGRRCSIERCRIGNLQACLASCFLCSWKEMAMASLSYSLTITSLYDPPQIVINLLGLFALYDFIYEGPKQTTCSSVACYSVE